MPEGPHSLKKETGIGQFVCSISYLVSPWTQPLYFLLFSRTMYQEKIFRALFSNQVLKSSKNYLWFVKTDRQNPFYLIQNSNQNIVLSIFQAQNSAGQSNSVYHSCPGYFCNLKKKRSTSEAQLDPDSSLSLNRLIAQRI